MSENRKSIQILRGASSYEPSDSDEVLLDGQPFYSKKTKKLYIGDGESPISDLAGTTVGLNLNQGRLQDSLQQDTCNAWEAHTAAFGEGTNAVRDHQFIVGRYNSPDSSYAFQVGCGDSDSSRRNAFSVDFEGRASVLSQATQPNELVCLDQTCRIPKHLMPLSDLPSIVAKVNITDAGDGNWELFGFTELQGVKFIDWGDGRTELGLEGQFFYDHDYQNNGTYECRIYLDDTVHQYLYQTFYSRQSLIEVEFPDDVIIDIYGEAFAYCDHLKRIKFGNKTRNISGYDIFYGCTNLLSVSIPSSVSTIADLAFRGSSLKIIYMQGIVPPEITDQSVDYLLFPSNVEKVIVPYEALSIYQQATVWNGFAELIDTYTYSGTTVIEELNLVNGSKLNSIQQLGTVAYGASSFSQGSRTAAMASNSSAFGQGTLTQSSSGSVDTTITLNDDGSINSAKSWGIATGNASMIIGKNCIAAGEASIAGGSKSYTSGFGAVAIGNGNQALNSYAVALGSNNKAYKFADFAAGQQSVANGGTSVAIGHTANASGYVSYAAGYHTNATHDYSATFGAYNNTSASSQFVVGKYNASNSDALFVVGNGTSDTAAGRTNAFVVLSDGRAQSETAPSEGKDLVNKAYVDELVAKLRNELSLTNTNE